MRKCRKWVAFMHKGEARFCGAIQLMSPSCYIHEHKEAIKQDRATADNWELWGVPGWMHAVSETSAGFKETNSKCVPFVSI